MSGLVRVVLLSVQWTRCGRWYEVKLLGNCRDDDCLNYVTYVVKRDCKFSEIFQTDFRDLLIVLTDSTELTETLVLTP